MAGSEPGRRAGRTPEWRRRVLWGGPAGFGGEHVGVVGQLGAAQGACLSGTHGEVGYWKGSSGCTVDTSTEMGP